MRRKLLTCHLLSAIWIAGSLILTDIVRGQGTFSGRVLYEEEPPAPATLKADKDVEVCGVHPVYSEALIISESGGIKNVFVQLVGVKGEVKQPETRPSLTQKGCLFIPHVQVIPVMTRMNIYNEDGIAHNIHTLSLDNPSFNQQQPGAKKRMVTKKDDFTIPEIVPVKCDIHGWMKAWIIVTDHPYHAISDEDGSFGISSIPAGDYTVEFWHETLGKQTREVTVSDGDITEVNLVFKPGR